MVWPVPIRTLEQLPCDDEAQGALHELLHGELPRLEHVVDAITTAANVIGPHVRALPPEAHEAIGSALVLLAAEVHVEVGTAVFVPVKDEI